MQDYINRQVEQRARAWEEAKGLLDKAASESRDLTGEEQQTYDRINADLDERARVIETLKKDMDREAAAAELRVADAPTPAPQAPSDVEMFRRLISGEVRSVMFGESRDLQTDTATKGPELVPQGFYNELQRKLQYTGPMLDESVVTVLRTGSGNDIKVPVESTRSVGTATAEGAVFAESDPTLATITLRSHKFGSLVQVSSELLTDAEIADPDLIGYLSDQFAVALGTAVNSVLTLGTGTVQPNGISTAATTAGATGGTAVGGAFTFGNLIDLVHSVDSAYASRPKVGFMLRRATLGKVRGLQDTAGNFIYAVNALGPDTLLGYPVYENPFIPAVATSAKSVLFGDLGAYHTRLVAPGIEVARSDDFGFANDLITFRASIRIGGDLGGGRTDAVKHFVGGAS